MMGHRLVTVREGATPTDRSGRLIKAGAVPDTDSVRRAMRRGDLIVDRRAPEIVDRSIEITPPDPPRRRRRAQ